MIKIFEERESAPLSSSRDCLLIIITLFIYYCVCCFFSSLLSNVNFYHTVHVVHKKTETTNTQNVYVCVCHIIYALLGLRTALWAEPDGSSILPTANVPADAFGTRPDRTSSA
eukprot:PhM_4_TR183/c0_g1_i1/m.16690